ncbi:CRISPR-associated protein DevS [[Clostridium] ultunense Esp]|uniref:CRISPR-associated protein Cas5 n=1 Tax=Thermicanus aegyptius TaxID=94009 RepID=UPI0002B70FAA|nr:CRISPR-associated protein Cas5 [Thermicanus aegyptius]CCQ92535.1 CRISPR-associated protein DevS [[Clostridium] ultunense Esp]
MADKGKSLWLSISVPISSFAIPQAREFVESFPFPPPATVYGMLLSLIGEKDRSKYKGTRLGILVESLPATSMILRKIRRVKNKDLNHPTNVKPDYQMLLTGLSFIVHVSEGEDMKESIVTHIEEAVTHPERINRFGGLSCGESHHLVDQIKLISSEEVVKRLSDDVWVLIPTDEGDWACPVWVDHVGSEKTVWERAQFRPIPSDFTLDDMVNFQIRNSSSI